MLQILLFCIAYGAWVIGPTWDVRKLNFLKKFKNTAKYNKNY